MIENLWLLDSGSNWTVEMFVVEKGESREKP